MKHCDLFNVSFGSTNPAAVLLLTFISGMITVFSSSPSTRRTSSTKPPCLRPPLELSLTATTSNLAPFLKLTLTQSFENCVFFQSISFLNAGNMSNISSTFSLAILAACSFSYVIVKAFYPLLLTLQFCVSSAYVLTISFDLGCAASWVDYIFSLPMRCP